MAERPGGRFRLARRAGAKARSRKRASRRTAMRGEVGHLRAMVGLAVSGLVLGIACNDAAHDWTDGGRSAPDAEVSDTTPPTLLGITTSALTASTATIIWSTDEPA